MRSPLQSSSLFPPWPVPLTSRRIPVAALAVSLQGLLQRRSNEAHAICKLHLTISIKRIICHRIPNHVANQVDGVWVSEWGDAGVCTAQELLLLPLLLLRIVLHY